MSKRSKSKGKLINPTYWVFCEGKTEEAYVSHLRTKYRLPIEITSKVAGSNINEHFIRKCKVGKPTHQKDKDFLMYDGDVESTIRQLQSVSSANLIISNPSIELWFLYHYKNQKAAITTAECIKQLSNRSRVQYKKGQISGRLKEKLDEKWNEACQRASGSRVYNNPSSNVHVLIEELEKVKKAK